MSLPADLAPERIAALLRTHALGRSLDVRAETESTMDDARAVAATARSGHVVVADSQTRGRGTHGRSWESPRGVDLYVSAIVRPNVELADLGPLTLAVGLGVAEALDTCVDPQRVRIKWPNDVYVDGKKCAGILVESRSIGEKLDAVVVGIGVNVNRVELPAELAKAATSLAIAKGGTLDRARVLASVLAGVESWVDRFESEGRANVVRAVDARLLHRGALVRLDELRGTLVGVDASGGIRVATDVGELVRLAGRLEPCE